MLYTLKTVGLTNEKLGLVASNVAGAHNDPQKK